MMGRKEKATQKWLCRKGPNRAHPRERPPKLQRCRAQGWAPGVGGDESGRSMGPNTSRMGGPVTTRPRAHSGAKGPPPCPRQGSPASAAVMAVPRGLQSRTQDADGEKPVPRWGGAHGAVPTQLPAPGQGCISAGWRREPCPNQGGATGGQVGSGRRERMLDLTGLSPEGGGWAALRGGLRVGA